jgi:NTP pyrophosphatase (non-canonical NTP hydrolase)
MTQEAALVKPADIHFAEMLNAQVRTVFNDNVRMGWYTDPATGLRKDRNVGEMLALIHSEVSEALEGYRKSLMDTHLPHRPMLEVELADVLIRVFDLAGYLKLDLGGAYEEKRAYNATRADHKLENRAKEGGKKI